MEETKNKKKVNILNIFICILFSIFIIFEICIWIMSFHKNTINICGYMPYITMYQDKAYGFKEGDLAITNKKDIFNDEVVYKNLYNGDIIILTGNEYDELKNKSKYNAEDIFNLIIKKAGKVILFLREPYIVLIVTILIELVCIIIYTVRASKDDELDKKYKRIRNIKDILIIIFIITTYISIFLIGKINTKNSNNKNAYTGTLPENVINNTDANNVSENSINNIESNTNTNYTQNKNGNFSTTSGGSSTNSNENTGKVIDTDIEFIVTDSSKSWSQMENLNIFRNDYFYNENKIFPGMIGKYEFNVENKSKYNFKYKISFEEQNNYGINLKYKLIKNGQYLNNEYKSANELNHEECWLSSSSKDVYILEWKWVDNDNDTQIGENANNVNYNLKISVVGEQE